MCRIYGQLNAGLADPDIRRAGLAMTHGGPDSRGLLTGPGWALGANRLAIMDPGGGQQPFSLGGIHVAYNGEIYNHRELRAELAGHGYHLPGHCDGSVLPALYHRYGTAFTEHLDGMYAIAVLDTRAEPTLVLATDPSGMKPLYYADGPAPGGLAFASEIPALLTLPGVRPDPWRAGLDAYLTTRAPFGEQTMIAGIRVLPPATTATFTAAGGLRRRTRTEAEPGEVPERTTLAALTGQVRRLAEADVPVAAIASGGLDSSLVTALAAQRAQPLHTFTIGYRGRWPMDERGYARQVAAACGTVHHEVEIDPATLPGLLTDTIGHLGQPNADPITVSTLALFRAVRDAGFKAALTGDAADEHFGGYDRIRAAMAAPPGTGWVPDYIRALAAVPARWRERLYAPGYRDYLRGQRREQQRLHERLAQPRPDRFTAIAAVEIGERLPAYHLRRVDHLSMAASVEARLPFCQPQVTQAAARLPAGARGAPGRGKLALYAAARGLLPAAVLDRPKQPFTLPITAMLAPGSVLYGHARDVLAPAELRADGELDPAAVAGLLRRQAEHPDATAALAVWSLLVYRHWRSYLARGAQPPVSAAALGRAA